MASDYACCPICMEDYDLENKIPKSLDCRHSLCNSCLLRDGKLLKKCPCCRQPIASIDKVVNDLTMIDYLERKLQKRREREQGERKAKLRDLLEDVSKELLRTEADLDKRKQTNLVVAKEKLDVFHTHAKQIFSEALVYQSDNEEVVSKMASMNTGELNDKIQLLQEHTTLVTSLLEQSYINEHDFEERRGEIQKLIQPNTSPLEDAGENLWNIYREFLLDQFRKASKDGPSTDHKDPLGTACGIMAKIRQSLFVYRNLCLLSNLN